MTFFAFRLSRDPEPVRLNPCPASQKVVSYGSATPITPQKRKAMVEDTMARHEALLEKIDGPSSSSFRPKQSYRASVVKILSMVDNQVSLWVSGCRPPRMCACQRGGEAASLFDKGWLSP